MEKSDRYSLDSDELDELIRELTTCHQNIDRCITDFRRQMRVLESEWEGLSAEAQKLARAELDKGLDAMALALSDLIAENNDAHGLYVAAWQANVDMWRAVQ